MVNPTTAPAYCLISHKVDFRANETTWDKEDDFVMMESIYQENITILYIMHPIKTSNCMKKNLT